MINTFLKSYRHFKYLKFFIIIVLTAIIAVGCGGSDDNSDSSNQAHTLLTTYYLDSDGDGYGNFDVSVQDTALPSGYSTTNDDCDDNNEDSHPYAAEICGDGLDNDCDGTIDEGCNTFWVASNDRHIAHYRINQTDDHFNCYITDWTQTNRTGLGTIEYESDTLFGSGSILDDNYYFDDSSLMAPIPWILSDDTVGSLGYNTIILTSSLEDTMQTTLNYELYDAEKNLIETGTSSSTWTRDTTRNDTCTQAYATFTSQNCQNEASAAFEAYEICLNQCGGDQNCINACEDPLWASMPSCHVGWPELFDQGGDSNEGICGQCYLDCDDKMSDCLYGSDSGATCFEELTACSATCQ